MNRTPILMVGFGDAASGFSRVVHSIAEHLPEHFEIHHLAVNVRGRISQAYPWKIYPNDIKCDRVGEIKLRQLIDRIRPRLVWILNDFWFLARYYLVLRDYKDEIKTVAYMPLDGRITQPGLLGALQFFDVVTVYNEFSRAELDEKFDEVAKNDPDFSRPELAVIPHGVDGEKFNPLLTTSGANDSQARRRSARRALYGPNCPFEDGFIVLNANQNATRKRIEVTMKGFALFAQDKPRQTKLHLHCTKDRGPYNDKLDVHELARELDIADRLISTTPPVTDSRLNLIYNACDVGINTSWGEGWGLISLEHGATNAAQIVPDHTACAEIWPGAAELLPARECDRSHPELLEKRLTTPLAVADALERLYTNPDYRDRLANQAFRLATRPEYQWKEIGREWDRLFRSLLENSPLRSPMARLS